MKIFDSSFDNKWQISKIVSHIVDNVNHGKQIERSYLLNDNLLLYVDRTGDITINQYSNDQKYRYMKYVE